MVAAGTEPGVAALLADQLLSSVDAAADGVRRRVVLWLDPTQGFRRLWPMVADELRVRSALPLVCEGESDQLRVKVELLRLEGTGEGVAVVYLPGYGPGDLSPRPDGTTPSLWSVYDQRYKGVVWGIGGGAEPGEIPSPPTLLDWLAAAGVRIDEAAASELAEGGADSLLARYAELQARRPPSAWPSPLTRAVVLDALGGDPRDALRELIAAPSNAVKAWGERAELVLGGIASAFGLERPDDAGPEEIADAVTVQLALAEAWDAFGRPPDFPFRARLPASEEQRERCARFLRVDVLPHRELAPRYRERILRLEKQIDLTGWAAGRPGMPRGLPMLARARWRAFLERFDALAEEDWRAARELLRTAEAEIEAGRSTPWDGPGGDTQWFVVADARELADLAGRARSEAASCRSVAELVAGYSERWWRVDRLHLAVRAGCSETAGLERVRRVADLSYFEYVEVANDRFAELLDAEGAWPPSGVTPVTTLPEVLWKAGSGRRGVVVTDALRLDLARDLAASLAAEVAPVISVLPSMTPFGMTALLPVDPRELSVGFEKGVSLTAPDGSKLSTRDGRKSYLSAQVGGGKGKLAFVDLDEVLGGTRVPDAGIVVVFDDTIDSQGHEVPEELPGLAEALVGKLRRAVERLHEAGVAEVHVVTDHGFLLLPPDRVDGLGRPEVPVAQVLRRESRWCALKPGVSTDGLLRFPPGLGGDGVTLGFPRGVRTLVAAADFLHGGISLQETVIPHVVSRVRAEAPRLEVEVAVTTTDLVTGTVPVVMRPLPQELFGQRPARLRLWVEPVAGGDPVTDPLEIEVRPDANELRPPLYLREGMGLQAGTELVLRAVEVDSGRDVASIPLRMAVDWE